MFYDAAQRAQIQTNTEVAAVRFACMCTPENFERRTVEVHRRAAHFLDLWRTTGHTPPRDKTPLACAYESVTSDIERGAM